MSQQRIDRVRTWAQNSYKQNKYVVPTFIIHSELGDYAYDVSDCIENKSFVFNTVKALCAGLEAYAYSFVSEAWFAKIPKEEVENLDDVEAVSERADKKQGIVASFVSHDIKSVKIYEINDGKIVADEGNENESAQSYEGPMAELLPSHDEQASYSKELKKEIIDLFQAHEKIIKL